MPVEVRAAVYKRWILHSQNWFTSYAPGVIMVLLLGLAGIAYTYNLTGWLMSDDEGNYLYAAWRVSTGEVPYRDFFTPQLPAFLYTGGALFNLLGPSVSVARASTMIATLLAALCLFLTIRRIARPGLGLLAALVFLAHRDVYAVAREFRPEAYMLLAITAGTCWLIRADESPDRRPAVMAGLFFALGFLTKLFAILPLVGWSLFLVYRILQRKITIRAAVVVGCWVLVPLALIVLAVFGTFYFLAPQLPDAILFHHLRQGANLSRWEVMNKGIRFLSSYGYRSGVFLWLPVALGVFRTFKDPRRRLPLFAFQIPTALSFLVLSRDLYDRHLVYLIPALALLFVLGLETMVEWNWLAAGGPWTAWARYRWRVVRPVATGLSLAVVGLFTLAAMQPMLVANLNLAKKVDEATLPLAAYIASHTRPDELVVSDYAGLNFYARRKTTYLAAGLSAGAATSGQITGARLIQEMQSHPVAMILLQDFTPVIRGQLVALSDYDFFRGYVQGAFHFMSTQERNGEYHRVYTRGEPEMAPLDVNFGGELRLDGYALEEPAVGSGEILYVVLAWQAIQQLAGDYKLYLHVEDAQGHLWATRDELLVNGPPFEATSTWTAHQRVVRGYGVQIPTGTPPGEYTLKLGLYEASNPAHRLLPLDNLGKPTSLEYHLTGVRVIAPQRHPAWLWPAQVSNTPPEPLQVRGLELVGYDPVRQTLDAGQDLGIRLFWRARQPLDADYRLRLRLPGAAPEIIAPLGGPAYPSHLWAPGQVIASWHDLRTDVAAASGKYPVTLNLLDPDGQSLLAKDLVLETVQITQVPRLFTIPPIQYPLSVGLEDGITFLGYELPECRAEEDNSSLPAPRLLCPPAPLRLTVYWQARAQPQAQYTVFVHLLDETGQIRGQVDRVPMDGTRPTTGWLPGEVIRDEFVLPIPTETTGGSYRIQIGMYDATTMRRLTTSPAGDQVLLPDVVVVESR